MTPGMMKSKPTAGALRAATSIAETITGYFGEAPSSSMVEFTATIVDRETGASEIVDILENIIAEAGDLIESRSPELVAHARAALRRYSDEAPRQAE
jgi:hypothetical protein